MPKTIESPRIGLELSTVANRLDQICPSFGNTAFYELNGVMGPFLWSLMVARRGNEIGPRLMRLSEQGANLNEATYSFGRKPLTAHLNRNRKPPNPNSSPSFPEVVSVADLLAAEFTGRLLFNDEAN